ncbi:MAG: 5'/3'-nucleotidase SurE [Glaciecola sp.]
MNILLSNDDSAFAKGIQVLYQTLALHHNVTVIAPDRNCSGASNALSLHDPLRLTQLENGFYAVNGTPSDCVQLGVNSHRFPSPDIVISGINHGANLGDDVIYSGTVAAATEGRHLGCPALAVSIDGYQDWQFETAAHVIATLLDSLSSLPMNDHQILNINVPNVPIEQLSGWSITRLGSRHKAENMVQSSDPFGRDIFWYGRLGSEQDAGQGTDFYAIGQQQVSITPISIDMTDHQGLASLNHWLDNARLNNNEQDQGQ